MQCHDGWEDVQVYDMSPCAVLNTGHRFEEVRRGLQPYEDAGAFLRLALTGDLLEKLQHLNGVLDSAFAGGRLDVPERLRNWQRQLEQEREQRTEMYGVLLQREERREEALPVEWEDQLELLTMLKAGFETYSEVSKLKEHPLTDAEEQLVSSAYDLLASRSGIVIPSLPAWFVAGTDASDASKLTRLGLSSSRPKSGASEEVVETASQWWELHHPHIVRFMGACHVVKSPYFVHEQTRSLAMYLGANRKTRADVWKRLLEAARGEIAYPVVDENKENGAHSTIDNLDQQELPGLGFNVTVREFLDEFDEFSSEPGEPTRKAFTRLLQLHEMMKEAVPSPEPMVVKKYLSLLSRIMDAIDKRSSFSASVQASGSRYIDQTALTFNAEIERVFRLLNVHEGLRVDSAPDTERTLLTRAKHKPVTKNGAS
ncbi:hypothetical protein BBJ28_00018471 [Nothophytophthora sp. Chile5]|nr:hypothetical protein BBJ28_00018471 [Nothophytophthora sp. Chile5]